MWLCECIPNPIPPEPSSTSRRQGTGLRNTIGNEIIAKLIWFQGCFRNCYFINYQRLSFLQQLVKLILWRLLVHNLALPESWITGLMLQEFSAISWISEPEYLGISSIFMDIWSTTHICAYMSYRWCTYRETNALDLCALPYLAWHKWKEGVSVWLLHMPDRNCHSTRLKDMLK